VEERTAGGERFAADKASLAGFGSECCGGGDRDTWSGLGGAVYTPG